MKTTAHYKYQSDGDLQIREVRDIWKLPNLAPSNQMTISSRAAEVLDPCAMKDGPCGVVQTLWNDIEKEIRNSCHDIHAAFSVASTLGDFCVVEHLCGRVAIYLPDEVPERFRN